MTMSFVGIDLGTTFSAISHLDASGRPAIVPLRDGPRLLPSAIWAKPGAGDQLLVGDIAVNQLGTTPELVAQDFKRHMGSGMSFQLGDRSFSPTELSSFILRRLKQDYEDSQGVAITSAVISVPAHFQAEAREATLEAARRAGLPCEFLINEPTAAILSSSRSMNLDGTVLVFDLGGGTFDATIATVCGGEVEVLTSEGDLDLGGRDFDNALLEIGNRFFVEEHGYPLLGDQPGSVDRSLSQKRYQADAVRTKIDLSTLEDARLTLTDREANKTTSKTVLRSEFERALVPFLGKAESVVDLALENAKLQPADIDYVLLVGGSVRVPAVKALLERSFGADKVRLAPNVDEAVCLGAAVRAGLAANPHLLSPAQKATLAGSSLAEVTNKSYGTLTLADPATGRLTNTVILSKDTPIPCSKSDTFYTIVDGQTTVNCQLTEYPYDEEDADLVPVKLSEELALPPGRPAGQEIRVTYSYDVNQVIHCEFLDVASGRKASFQVEPGRGGSNSSFNIDDFVID